jgi:hypothetical protein
MPSPPHDGVWSGGNFHSFISTVDKGSGRFTPAVEDPQSYHSGEVLKCGDLSTTPCTLEWLTNDSSENITSTFRINVNTEALRNSFGSSRVPDYTVFTYYKAGPIIDRSQLQDRNMHM